jgi:MFS family permease
MKKANTLKQAMKISVIEGTFAQIYFTLTAIGSNFITKAAVVLNANHVQFSLLSSVSQLCQLFQLYAVYHNKNLLTRKKPCIQYAFWGRFISLLLCVCFTISNPKLAFIFFISILLLSTALATISSNMWVAWMTDLIPKQIRGRFFSQRMQIHLLCAFLIGYVFSFFIDLFEVGTDTLRYSLISKLNLNTFFVDANLSIGLSIVFITGTVLGLCGLKILQKQSERKIKNSGEIESFVLFEPLKSHDFRKLLRFGLWWMFAVGVGAPFWSPFMIQTLKMSLVQMQIYTMLQTVGMIVSFTFWGKFIDRFGNKTAMKICVFLGAINPAVWVFFTESNYSIIWLEAVSSGIMWSGANLIAFNFVLALAPRGKEQHWSAVYSSLCGLMMMSTILLSGIFFPKKMIILNHELLPEQILFATTALLRLSALIPLCFVVENKAVSLRRVILLILNKMRFLYK